MYRLSAKAGSKGQGASASKHADYILREGKYNSREDLQHSDYGNMPNFIGSDPREFWKLSDLNEGENRTVYREIELALPIKSTKEQRIELVDQFTKKNLVGHAYTYAIHDVEGNPHAHVMFCDRKHDCVEREPEQFFKRANQKAPEKGGCAKSKEWGGKDRADHIEIVRKSWATIQNDHFKRIGSIERVDHRTLAAQRAEALEWAGYDPAILKDAALLDREPDRRISSRRWKLMERTKELDDIRKLRQANRDEAEAKAQIIDLQAQRGKRQPQHIVPEPEPAKTVPAPVSKPEKQKNQEDIHFPDAHLVEDPRPVAGSPRTTTSSVPVDVSPTQPLTQKNTASVTDNQPPVNQTKPLPQQPAVEPVAVDPAWLKWLERLKTLIQSWKRPGSTDEFYDLQYTAIQQHIEPRPELQIDIQTATINGQSIQMLIIDQQKALLPGQAPSQIQGRKI